MAPAQMFAWRPTRRSDTEELLLLGFEILVGDDALISELGEPLQLAHVLGFGCCSRVLAATKVFLRPKPALDERATPLHARHGPVGLPRPLRCAPRSAISPIYFLLPLCWSDFLDSTYAQVTTSSVSSSSRASSVPRSRFHLMVRSGRMSSPAERFPLGDFSCPNFVELRKAEVQLPRTPYMRSSQNSYSTHSGE